MNYINGLILLCGGAEQIMLIHCVECLKIIWILNTIVYFFLYIQSSWI